MSTSLLILSIQFKRRRRRRRMMRRRRMRRRRTIPSDIQNNRTKHTFMHTRI